MPTHLTNLRRNDPAWPTEFDQVELPPDELWVRGRLDWLAREPRVAIVGTRAPTEYGLAQARRFAGAFAAAGVSVVSGLARGIDACAHEEALDRGGVTIAIVGSGADRPWPDGAATQRMCDEGTIVSELAPGTPPRRHHFPLRNRLIAGLARAVVVVEAAARSGSLITARWAIDLGREVFAVPGRVDQPMAAGCLELLAQGARVARSPADVLREFANDGACADAAALPEVPLLSALDDGPRDVTELARQTRLPLGRALAELAELELDGRVARAPGGLYRRLA